MKGMGSRIAALRKQKGMTQERLAEAVGRFRACREQMGNRELLSGTSRCCARWRERWARM